MKNINIYIITCDKSNHILKSTILLLDKYWTIPKTIKILGFNKLDIKLPTDYEFISMRSKQLSIDDWGKDIYNIIKNDPNDLVIFMLDDFLPTDYLNKDIYNNIIKKMISDDDIVRCTLGIDMFANCPYDIIEEYKDYDIILQKQDSPYRITTQTSLWKKNYLLYHLLNSTNPWNFETIHKANDGKKVIGTIRTYILRWIEESALSNRHPNKINILGMKFEDIKLLIDLGFFDVNKLQYGQHIGKVPQFNEYRYDFRIEVLKEYVDDFTYKLYELKYKDLYKK